MSLQKLTSDDFEFFTLETNPKRTYSSSSIEGITGSVNLFARRSTVEKDVFASGQSESVFSDGNIESIRQIALDSTSSNIYSDVETYMSTVRDTAASTRQQQQLDIYRFNPPFSFNSNFLRKSFIRKQLMPHYRTAYPRSHWAVSNYNCLNFFTASNVPTDSVMLYPNQVLTDGTGSVYQISESFSFDFWVKPSYTTDREGDVYRAGSILHLTNSYCVSLHTGSSKDIFGLTDKFRIGVQLGDQANTSPSSLNPLATSTNELLFFSSDNSLPKDSWSHVTVTWAGHNKNFGSGSIYVNAVKDTAFSITSSLFVGHYSGSQDPTVLCVGNYYEGDNDGVNSLDRFFAADPSLREGLLELDGTSAIENPTAFSFTHPLNAELQEVKILNKYLIKDEVTSLNTTGPADLKNITFYLPPFFTEESPYRQFVGTHGGEMVTPFFEKDASSTTPFAAQMAFSCGGHYINLENYTRDLATGNYPRLWALTGSTWSPPSTTILSCNDFLYATGSNIKRLYQILPSDNGQFFPNFGLLSTLSQSMFVNDLGNSELGTITLNNIVSDTFDARSIVGSGSMISDVVGSSPSDVIALPGNSLSILHQTRDSSSNQVVIFDISNLFYGMSIKPKSLMIKDASLKYSKTKITLRDDGRGNLFRADATPLTSTTFSPYPTWSSVGNVFYDEGLVVIKSPQLYFFGEEQFEIELKGIQNIHVTSISAIAKPMSNTESSSPSYKDQVITPDMYRANETDNKSVYITGINVHDENLNVIMRSKLAQPVLKRSADKIIFKTKLDY